jgi:hypothetical protein
MTIENSIQFRGVYFLESKNPNMNPIAIRPAATPPDYVSWEDTGHGRIIRFSKILVDGKEIQDQPTEIPERIEITGQNGQVYQLVKLTLPIFNEKLKHVVAGGGSLNFNNDEELQEYYLKADFYTAG